MKTLILGILAIVLTATVSQADAVTLTWDVVAGATKYTIYQSIDLGVTWTKLVDATAPPIVTTVANDKLFLFRVSASNAVGERINFSRGAWYNGAWEIAPTGIRAN